MRSGHRSAHLIVVLAATVVGGGAFVFAWTERAARASRTRARCSEPVGSGQRNAGDMFGKGRALGQSG